MSERIQRTIAFAVLAFCLAALSWIATETTELVVTERVTVSVMVVVLLFLSVNASARKA